MVEVAHGGCGSVRLGLRGLTILRGHCDPIESAGSLTTTAVDRHAITTGSIICG